MTYPLQIMREYEKYKTDVKNQLDLMPHVLGLTASLVTQKCDKLKFVKLKTDLEKATDCKVITTEENLSDLLK